MGYLTDAFLSLLIPASINAHLLLSPFTKVEESFNIQAVHDILNYGISFSNLTSHIAANYDHIEFPGSVPRTFVGALILSGISHPIIQWFQNPELSQLIVRAVLGFLNAASLLAFRTAIIRAYGMSTGNWYSLLQASQFHVIYYASRTLPNTLAFFLTNLALRSYLIAISNEHDQRTAQRHHRISLVLLTITGIVFRSELAVLVFTQTTYLLRTNRASYTYAIIPAGVLGLCLGLLITVPVDSLFWQKYPLWPEWTGFYYNTILGQSSSWGTSPVYFYFLNALPRLLFNPLTYLVLIPTAIWSPATRSTSLALVIPELSFVAIYSLLPHKEWRFIVYVIPGLTATSAMGATWIWNRRSKSVFYRLLAFGLGASVLASFIASSALLRISILNYPGGQSVVQLRNLVAKDSSITNSTTVHVYADNLACQTGLTRFLEWRAETVQDGRPRWAFDKTENQTALLEPRFWDKFDYALVESPERTIGKWEVERIAYGLGGVKMVKPNEKLDTTGQWEPGSNVLETEIAAWPAWEALGEKLRNKYTRGWWITARLRPMVKILKKQR